MIALSEKFCSCLKVQNVFASLCCVLRVCDANRLSIDIPCKCQATAASNTLPLYLHRPMAENVSFPFTSIGRMRWNICAFVF